MSLYQKVGASHQIVELSIAYVSGSVQFLQLAVACNHVLKVLICFSLNILDQFVPWSMVFSKVLNGERYDDLYLLRHHHQQSARRRAL